MKNVMLASLVLLIPSLAFARQPDYMMLKTQMPIGFGMVHWLMGFAVFVWTVVGILLIVWLFKQIIKK